MAGTWYGISATSSDATGCSTKSRSRVFASDDNIGMRSGACSGLYEVFEVLAFCEVASAISLHPSLPRCRVYLLVRTCGSASTILFLFMNLLI